MRFIGTPLIGVLKGHNCKGDTFRFNGMENIAQGSEWPHCNVFSEILLSPLMAVAASFALKRNAQLGHAQGSPSSSCAIPHLSELVKAAWHALSNAAPAKANLGSDDKLS